MPRFQSRLFNWIDQSLPAKLGRRTRQMLDRQFKQIPNVSELPRLLGYQVAKAALYPVYLIASTAKRRFPALNGNKADSSEKLRSQPDSGGLLPEADAIAENFESVIEQDLPLEIPLLLRPLVKFLSWIDRTKINIDRNINAIIKRRPDNLVTSTSSEISSETNSELNSELATRLLANRMFAEIWQQRLGQSGAAQGEGEQNSLRENNGLAENVALGKNTRLEQLRRLIEAAITYFFGNQSDIEDDRLIDDEELLEDFSINNSEVNEAISDSPQLRRKKIKSSTSPKNQLQKNAAQSSSTNAIDNAAANTTSNELKENATLTQNSNLERLRELIAAAIDYFIGKRSLDGDMEQAQEINNIQGQNPEMLAEESSAKIQTGSQNSTNRTQNFTPESSNPLKVDDQIERLQKLIEDAIAYFFGKERSKPSLDETSDITPSKEAWLKMEEVFGDDNGPWPLPLEYESHAFTKSPDMGLLNSSGELQNFETTTTQISQDRLEGSLLFGEEIEFEEELLYQNQNPDSNSDRPLRAWIEANAVILGYTYNPIMTVILWIDAIVLKLENVVIAFWRAVVNFPKRLLHFIRYGNRR
ncbi:MAG: hypothetical protein ACOYN8_07850 [Pseudanabaena sp.]|jgi:hypothetical protein